VTRGAAWLLAGALRVALQDPAADADPMWELGQRDQALAAWERELAADPADAVLRRRLASRLMEAQRWEAALRVAEPLGAEADGLRGSALFVLARYEEALRYLSAADPAQALLRVEALDALGRAQQADAAVEEAARVLGEGHPRVAVLRGRRLVAAGRFADALPHFRSAHAADPLDREALFGLGQALVRTGAREEGLALLQRHREVLPLLDARDFALQSLGLDPSHAANHARLGDAERALGRLDQAEAAYLHASALAGSAAELSPVILRHARLLHEDRGDLAAALALLDQALARAPDTRLAVRAGDLLAGAGRTAEARERYARALALRPGDAQIEQRLAALPPDGEASP